MRSFLWRSLALSVILGLQIGFGAASAQQINEVASPVYLNELIAKATNTAQRPVKIIFIPGILGSKLTDPASGHLVWGDANFGNPKLEYDGHTTLEPSFFDVVSLNLIFTRKDIPIYGGAIDRLKNKAHVKPEDVLTFSYDWRQSNWKTAKDFNTWLCNQKEGLNGSDVIIAAHSMGGLVLKNWFVDFYDQGNFCGATTGDFFDIRKVYFVGTPHYGATKALNALFEGYSLYDNFFLKALTSTGLNRYGYSFDSLYELLPLQNNGVCGGEIAGHTSEKSVLIENSSASAQPSVIDIEFMRRNNLPSETNGHLRTEFQTDRLQPLLKQIEQRACVLAGYRFPKLGMDKVVMVYGIGSTNDDGENNTIAFLKLEGDTWEPQKTNGDGTVPVDSASWNGAEADANHEVLASADHGSLMDNPAVQQALARSVAEIVNQHLAAAQAAGTPAYNKITDQLASDGKILMPTPDDPAYQNLVQTTNAAVFKKIGWNSANIEAAAKDLRNLPLGNDELSYSINDYLAKSPASSEYTRFVTTQATAKELLDLGYSKQSNERFSATISTSDELLRQFQQSGELNRRNTVIDLTAKSLNSRGTLELNAGNKIDARKDLERAFDLGNRNAGETLRKIFPAQ